MMVPLIAPAPDVCAFANVPEHATINVVDMNAARIRWGQKYETFITGSP
jgi:hypothetical protein